MTNNRKILVIDNAAFHSAHYQLLIKEGYEVDIVLHPDAGLQKLQNTAYDIIIAQESRESRSWQLCEEIRRLSGMPLIVISPNASADACVRAIKAGADYFLRKPFGPLEFSARVHSLLQRVSPNPSPSARCLASMI